MRKARRICCSSSITKAFIEGLLRRGITGFVALWIQFHFEIAGEPGKKRHRPRPDCERRVIHHELRPSLGKSPDRCPCLAGRSRASARPDKNARRCALLLPTVI